MDTQTDSRTDTQHQFRWDILRIAVLPTHLLPVCRRSIGFREWNP